MDILNAIVSKHVEKPIEEKEKPVVVQIRELKEKVSKMIEELQEIYEHLDRLEKEITNSTRKQA